MGTNLDLTDVGFTPTESLIYASLVELGPSSGYAAAKAAGIARANAYQALNGLVTKGAAVLAGDAPQLFRAKAPDVVLALIAEREATKLDRVERALRSLDGGGSPGLVPFRGEREFREVALRTAARAGGEVRCVAPPAILTALAPLWRKRDADGAATTLWSLEQPATLPVPLAGVVARARLGDDEQADPVWLEAESSVISALAGPEFAGFWTSEPALTLPVRRAIQAATSP